MPKKIYFTDIIWGLKVLQSQLVLLFDLQLLRKGFTWQQT